jgi:hypothetical protein
MPVLVLDIAIDMLHMHGTRSFNVVTQKISGSCCDTAKHKGRVSIIILD